MEDEIASSEAIKKHYIVYLMNTIKEKKEEKVKIADKMEINSEEIKTIKSLKYHIIDKYKKYKFCPCILSISIPFEDGFYCSELNDTPEKNLEECLFEDKIYVMVDNKRECDCGFNDLEFLSKREIFEIYNKKIKKLKTQFEIEINNKISKIKELEEINNEILTNYYKNINNLTKTDDNTNNKFVDNIYKDNKNNNKINYKETKSFLNPTFEDFYDVIIDIKSIKEINAGWEIKMNKKGEERFNRYKKKESLIIGVIGNSNRGKSFLLSKISKIDLPTGTSIRTEGLSIKYPELSGKYKNRNIILLDSAGLETPLLLDKENLKNIKEETNELNELLKEKARDKLMTELFLQNFIINNSNVLIAVVGILTYSEQKLLNRIREECKKVNKTLFIIHNLMTFTYIAQVKEYIKNFLLKDATFDLVERKEISTKKVIGKNVPYYHEKKEKIKIFHLIFANEGSEAGNYYNDFALNFFENAYQSFINIESFDIIQRLKERFIQLSKDLIEKNEKKLWIEENDFLNNEIILKEKIFKLKEKREIILKKCYIDELGFSNLRSNGFNPQYNYFERDNKIIVRIEVPGNSKITTDIKYSGLLSIIEIKGKKWKDKIPENFNDNLLNTREFGEFIIHIPLLKDFANKKPNIFKKEGIIIIEFDLVDNNNNIIYEFKNSISEEL